MGWNRVQMSTRKRNISIKNKFQAQNSNFMHNLMLWKMHNLDTTINKKYISVENCTQSQIHKQMLMISNISLVLIIMSQIVKLSIERFCYKSLSVILLLFGGMFCLVYIMDCWVSNVLYRVYFDNKRETLSR